MSVYTQRRVCIHHHHQQSPAVKPTHPSTPPTDTHPTYPPTYRKWQQILDRSTVHTGLRWLVFAGLMALYCTRVFFLNGWFIVTYGLGIYLLNNFIGFLSPQVNGFASLLWYC